MEAADDVLFTEITDVDTDLANTISDLDTQVADGVVQDGTLNDHNVRLTLNENNVGSNQDAIAALEQLIDEKTGGVVVELSSGSEATLSEIHELDRNCFILFITISSYYWLCIMENLLF